ncbi:hypothetical protein SAY86_029220 [Trapa natans]|uniref:Uncharacterized protein n=1 Tax=Trapa natans TaxID=22666 RepID=A0AAN7R9D6_TRANT|nr:hypothetical protein SAY86_029220 [Trapa natans]
MDHFTQFLIAPADGLTTPFGDMTDIEFPFPKVYLGCGNYLDCLKLRTGRSSLKACLGGNGEKKSSENNNIGRSSTHALAAKKRFKLLNNLMNLR